MPVELLVLLLLVSGLGLSAARTLQGKQLLLAGSATALCGCVQQGLRCMHDDQLNDMIRLNLCVAAGGVAREYFIAVETVEWQYADPAYNFCYGRNYSFDENAVVRTASADHVSPSARIELQNMPHPFNPATDGDRWHDLKLLFTSHDGHSIQPHPVTLEARTSLTIPPRETKSVV